MDRRRRAMIVRAEVFGHTSHLERRVRHLQFQIADLQNTLIRLMGERDSAKSENEYLKCATSIAELRLQIQEDINKSLNMEVAAMKSLFLNQQLNSLYSNGTNFLATAAQAPETGYRGPTNQATGNRDFYGQPVPDNQGAVNGNLDLIAQQQNANANPHLSNRGQK